MTFQHVICPISGHKIDSNISRLTVFMNVVLMAVFVVTLKPVFIAIVAADYLIRGVFSVRYSPVAACTRGVAGILRLKEKPIDTAPKIFASRLGLLCSLAAFLLVINGLVSASVIVACMLMALSVMDSVFDFCVGCLIYNYLVYPFFKNRT